MNAIKLGRGSLAFHVDRTGVPVLVKASYLPTSAVEGGTGPYRVAGNMTVVIPNSHTVRLVQKRRLVDRTADLSFAARLLGVLALVAYDRREHRKTLAEAARVQRGDR